eukprot:SAG31_NODE_1946_length_6844_cov_5.947665_6_plen_86_part_00
MHLPKRRRGGGAACTECEVCLGIVNRRVCNIVQRPVEQEPYKLQQALPRGLLHRVDRVLDYLAWQRYDRSIPETPADLRHPNETG